MATPPEIPWKWRQVATPKDVTSEAFAQLVLENKLEVIKSGGYAYAANRTDDGYDLYRTFDDWAAIPVSTGSTADPAAGAAHANITSATMRRLYLGFKFQGVFDATVVTRIPRLLALADGTNSVVTAQDGTGATAGVTRDWSFVPGIGVQGAGSGQVVVGFGPTDGLELPPGGIAQIAWTNLQAGDNLGVCYYYYKEAPA